jgi:hypothetical protein
MLLYCLHALGVICVKDDFGPDSRAWLRRIHCGHKHKIEEESRQQQISVNLEANIPSQDLAIDTQT